MAYLHDLEASNSEMPIILPGHVYLLNPSVAADAVRVIAGISATEWAIKKNRWIWTMRDIVAELAHDYRNRPNA